MWQGARPEPLYQSIKSYVIDHIASGQWPPGTRIPSEAEIAELTGASRMTVNRAIRELTADGRVTRIQGVGTFVAPPRPPATLLNIRSIGDEIAERGGTHSCRVLLKRSQPCPAETASALEVPPDSPIYRVLLVHVDDGRPVQIEDRLVNPAVAPEFLSQDFTRKTPSDYLLSFLPVTEIEHRIESRLPGERESELLQIAPSEPCLVLNRRSWAGRHVVTCVCLVSPGASYSVGGRFKVGSRQN